MDYVGGVSTSIGLLKDMWSFIYECFNYYKILDENGSILREKMERLKSREEDITTELENAQYQRQKKGKKEVENWLKEVEHIKDGAQKLEQEVGKRICFSRVRLLRRFQHKMKKVDELLELGKFSEGLLIDVPQDEGEALITTQLIGETTIKKHLEEIWTHLEQGEIQSIGVWGMGGVGKTTVVTHIHNRLLENKDTFGHVYWVTVSKESSIYRLQDDVAKKVRLGLSDEEDEKTRSARLFNRMQKLKKFVLILDGVWEVYAPQEVGIPIEVDGGKLIITTRSKDVCLRMGCKEIIKLELLSKDEAWELFNKTLERYNPLSPKEEEVAKDIVKECAGLPLAIVTTARSMSVVYDITEWRNALNELREHIKGHTIDMENDVFKILEFSYTRLNDKKLQECLLYCALFPEDCRIRKVSLIKQWIAEGLVDEMGTRQAELDRGYAILNKLENVCLLERCNGGKCVKMHDVIRDMAINIATKNSRFMIKTESHLNYLPREIKWSENLEKVSLMGNPLVPLISSPNCPKLSTLFLQRTVLYEVPNAFFVHMQGLKVLDLSYTDISSLPDSISDLVNLQALFLCHCYNLNRVPSLAKLQELRELDLSGSPMKAVPDGTEKLVHLKSLALRSVPIKDMSLSMALPNLLHLQCLRLDGRTNIDIGVEEVVRLRKLEILGVKFASLREFNRYTRTEHCRRLTHYHFPLKKTHEDRVEVVGREVVLEGYELKQGGKGKDDYQLVLPTNIQLLRMDRCVLPTSLLDVFPSLKNGTDLERCWISKCEGLEYLWWVEDCVASLNSLWLCELPNLKFLFKLRPHPPTNIGSFFSLKHLYVWECPNLKHMFTPELVKHHLQNLQTIHVYACSQMEDIIAAAEVKEEEGINEMENLMVCFPNLVRLELEYLPKLKSIWKGTLACDSLQQIIVISCLMLTRLPFSVHINNDDRQRRAPTPPLKKIHGQKEWWELVEWDTHPDAKYVFQSLFEIRWSSPYWLRKTPNWEAALEDISEDVD